MTDPVVQTADGADAHVHRRAADERRPGMVRTDSEGSFGRLTKLLQWLQINCQAAHDDITK